MRRETVYELRTYDEKRMMKVLEQRMLLLELHRFEQNLYREKVEQIQVLEDFLEKHPNLGADEILLLGLFPPSIHISGSVDMDAEFSPPNYLETTLTGSVLEICHVDGVVVKKYRRTVAGEL